MSKVMVFLESSSSITKARSLIAPGPDQLVPRSIACLSYGGSARRVVSGGLVGALNGGVSAGGEAGVCAVIECVQSCARAPSFRGCVSGLERSNRAVGLQTVCLGREGRNQNCHA